MIGYMKMMENMMTAGARKATIMVLFFFNPVTPSRKNRTLLLHTFLCKNMAAPSNTMPP